MKIVIVLIALVALLGGAYGLAKIGVIKTQQFADKSPLAAKALIALKLAKPKAKAMTVAVKITPVALSPADAAAQAELARERAEVAQEKAALDAKLQEASMVSKPPPPPSNPVLPTSPKLIAIYEAMDSEDLVKIFAKEPDSAVVSALAAMDEKKAANALALLPPERAAKITAMLNRATAPDQQPPQSGASSPMTVPL
jgi:flagellar motility protein MotE (MotC chaperone)